MLNASSILGALLQGGGPRGHAPGRLEHAMGDRGLGGTGGPLGQILGGLGGASGGSGRAGGGGGDILGSLAGMLGGGGSAGGSRPIGRDLMVGGLGALAASILSGRGRSGIGGGGLGGGKMRGAVGAGGLALLGMLAMNALRNRAQPASGPAGGVGAADAGGADPDIAAMPPEQALSEDTAGLVLRAMIDAAKADGRVDATERQRIVAKAQESGADDATAAYLRQEFERPADPDALVAGARDPVVAAQVYAASLLAIQVDTAEEQDYLRSLAAKLGLEPAVVAQLHGALGAPPPA